MGQRLVDEFQAELARRGLPLPGSLQLHGLFGDLLWKPQPDRNLILSLGESDPAFSLTGYSRWIALARIDNEVRIYAAPLPEGAPSWWWTGEDPARRAAVEAEPRDIELAIVDTVGDAVSFAVAYLGGTDLGRIDVARVRPSGARYASQLR
jgi:hypothetical protein